MNFRGSGMPALGRYKCGRGHITRRSFSDCTPQVVKCNRIIEQNRGTIRICGEPAVRMGEGA